MKRIIFAALVGVLVSGPAWAAEKETILDLFNFYDQADPKNQARMEEAFASMGYAMGVVNAEHGAKGHPPVFCQSKKLAITPGQYFAIFRKRVERNEKFLTLPADAKGVVLLEGLIQTFPCK